MRSQTSSVVDEQSGLSECFDRLAADKDRTRPLSTYRLQFNSSFRFVDGRELVPYLHALGVSTCYSSPLLQARAGSVHGYDITDHNKINPEIGTEEELREMSLALRERGMTLLLDVVPNHMGVGHGSNPWWQDVLRSGRASKFANFFDIDWNPLKAELRNKVLLPILGDQYGEELETGKLKVSDADGQFVVNYYDRVLPLDPHTTPLIFEPLGSLGAQDFSGNEQVLNEFRGLLIAFAELPSHDATEADRAIKRQREIPFIMQRFREAVERSSELRALIERALKVLNGNPGDAHSFDPLHKLLEAQAYRLAHWKVSAEEINYRRFFDINDLVGLRMEDPQVFAETQKLIRQLLADGTVSGLRIDHPDGLFNPPQYFTRLQMLNAAAHCCGEVPKGQVAENGIEADIQTAFGQHESIAKRAPLYVVVEKILEPGERLPDDWPVDGTVGYDFGNLVNGLFIDARNRRAFTTMYQRFIGEVLDVDAVIYGSKKLIMHSALASEVNVLGHMLDEISSTDRRARDFTRKVLRDAIRETIACFPVYRTYIDERGTITDRDRAYINEAIARAKRKNGSMAQQVFDFLRDILLLKRNDTGAPIYGYRKQLYFTLKFQQLTGPVMAKGLEDTACYVYNRFISVNEVGGSPKGFGIEVDEFHRANKERAEKWRYSMLSTSTHDTKRSEDVRMRLDVLSEMPRTWAAQAIRWRRANRAKKRPMADGRTVPDLNEEYLLYQTLVGAWPLQMEGAAAREEFTKRIQQYMTKAVHEAKVNLSWVNPDPDYVDRLMTFVQRILQPGTAARPNAFLKSAEEFIRKVAFFGAINSLAQTLIKLTAPGVPDIYQGQELWDFSLVDPDNRRKVDLGLRIRYLDEMDSRGDDAEYCAEMLQSWKDGRLKMWVTTRALRLRNELPELFHSTSYVPLEATEKERHVVAYARMMGRRGVVTVVPRFSQTMLNGEERWPLGDAWGDAEIRLPQEMAGREFRNALTGERFRVGESVAVREVLGRFPVGLLVME
jgi:(1->4)-alpha-D-glucan 1-alpha-D-glucosylmutase